MKLIQYLRVKLAQQEAPQQEVEQPKLGYDPDEAQALLDQSYDAYDPRTMAERIADTGRMLKNPELYFNSTPAKNEPAKNEPPIDEKKDDIAIYSRGAIDAQNDARKKQLDANLNSKSDELNAIQEKALPNKLISSLVGAGMGMYTNMANGVSDDPVNLYSAIPSFGIGSINGALAARKLFGRKAALYGALLGGGTHAVANQLAENYPLLRSVMGIANPVLGGIAGWNAASMVNSGEYEDKLKEYNETARGNAAEKAKMQAPLHPELFNR